MNELEIERLIGEGRFKEALTLLQTAWERHEYLDKESLLMNLAVCQLQLSEFDKARKTLTHLLEFSPDDTAALFNLAYADYSLGFYDEAVIIYNKLVDLEGMSEDIAYHLGMCNLYLDDTIAARESFERLIRSGKNIDMVYRIGITMISSGYPAEAIWIFTRFLQAKPNDIDATFGLGIAYIESRDYLHGIECFRRVLAWNGERYQSAYVMLGMAYFQVGKLKQAMTYLKKSLKLYPDSLETWFYLGVVYESTGQNDNALEVIRALRRFERSRRNMEPPSAIYSLRSKNTRTPSRASSVAYNITADSSFQQVRCPLQAPAAITRTRSRISFSARHYDNS
jgi:tetratricopeptide (TPR) repeat protein